MYVTQTFFKHHISSINPNGKLVAVGNLCGRKRSRACGHFLYDHIRHRCYCRHFIPIQSKCRRRRCGRHNYVTYTHQCCNGQVIPKSAYCPRHRRKRYGGVGLDYSTKKCYFCRMKPIHFTCPTLRCGCILIYRRNNVVTVKSGGLPCIQAQCGQRLSYEHIYVTQKCCNGRVTHILLPCTSTQPLWTVLLRPSK